ncbi:MAG: hypothetical protein HRU14_15985 [Planctomycetes bacterium]|nr:hypothetical protein [Planctomycetota bacterium]
MTREDELEERNAEVKALKNAEAKLKRELEALSKGRDDLIKELGEATADAARLKIEIQRLMDNPRGADAAALAAARDREARLTKSFKEAEATIEKLTNKLREYEEQPDATQSATLTIENVFSYPLRIMRLKCYIAGADKPEVKVLPPKTDITSNTRGKPIDLPNGTTKVTVVYDRFEGGGNNRFPLRPITSRQFDIEQLHTTIKIK